MARTIKIPRQPKAKAYFICSGEGDKYETYFTDGMKKFIINEK